MVGLKQFVRFDSDAFFRDKRLMAVGCKPWADHDSGALLGTRIDVLITHDGTKYAPGKDGKPISNQYQRLTIKVRKQISVPMESVIVPVNPVCTIWGDFQSELSVKTDDVKIVQQQGQAAPKA